MTGLWSAMLTVLAVALLTWPPRAVLAPPSEPTTRGAAGVAPATRRGLLVGAAVLAATLVANWWPWWVAVVISGAAGVATRRIPARPDAAQRRAVRRRLAVHADLLAACLDAGMPIGAALMAVSGQPPDGAQHGHDPPDPLALLDGVAALLMLGADPAKAWQSVQHHDELASLAAAASRSSAGGTTLADAVREHAVGLRASMTADEERSAGRAGVAMTAPLGLCFLPAFLCLGLAPVVVGLLSTLHLF